MFLFNFGGVITLGFFTNWTLITVNIAANEYLFFCYNLN